MSSAKSASDNIKKRVAMEPLRPRRNPNRIGYQAVAAGEKRTAGYFEELKSASKKSKAPNMYIFVVWFLYQFQPRFDQRNFKTRICVSKLNIYLGYLLCQAGFTLSHNILKPFIRLSCIRAFITRVLTSYFLRYKLINIQHIFGCKTKLIIGTLTYYRQRLEEEQKSGKR